MPVQCTCERCGKTFPMKPSRVATGRGRFCSRACAYAPRPGITGADGSILVPLNQGRFAVIDVEDAERVLAYNWTLLHPSPSRWYAGRKEGRRGIYMHRFIFGDDCPEEIDHADGDGLNNRRGNLRAATHSENLTNVKRPNKSGFRGVIWQANGWTAQMQCHKRHLYLGRYSTAEAAARAHDQACRECWGEFCVPNFPEDH